MAKTRTAPKRLPTCPRRPVAHPRRPLGADRAAPATPTAAPAGLPQPQGRRPPGHGRHLLRAPHRLPVERPERHRHLLQLLGPPPLPGVGRRRGLRQPVGHGAPGVRRAEGAGLGVAGDGRGDDQGPAGRRADRPESHRPGQAGHEAEPADGGQRGAGGPGRRGGQPPRQEGGRGDPGEHPGGAARADARRARRGCAWTRGTTTTTRGSWCGSSASRRMSGPGARRPRS